MKKKKEVIQIWTFFFIQKSTLMFDIGRSTFIIIAPYGINNSGKVNKPSFMGKDKAWKPS